MKVYLINPPDELDAMLGSGIEFVQKYEPLGLLYIAAVARDNSYDVSVIDAYAEGLSLEAVQGRIDEGRPDVIGISALTCNGAPVFRLGQ